MGTSHCELPEDPLWLSTMACTVSWQISGLDNVKRIDLLFDAILGCLVVLVVCEWALHNHHNGEPEQAGRT